MRGLAGVIFGKKRRRAEERDHLAWLFTRLLVLSESRGPPRHRRRLAQPRRRVPALQAARTGRAVRHRQGADVATQARLAVELAARAAHPAPGETNPQDGGFGRAEGTPEGREPWMASVNGAPGGRWGPVYGELLTFDDPETRLPAIDHLEGFLPGGPSLYRRVLVPASTRGQRVLVWLYVEGASRRPPGRRLADGVWRA